MLLDMRGSGERRREWGVWLDFFCFGIYFKE
jgi:hypothetical protein